MSQSKILKIQILQANFLNITLQRTPIKLNVKFPKNGDAFLGFGKNNFQHEPSLNLSKKGDLNEAAFNLFKFFKKTG